MKDRQWKPGDRFTYLNRAGNHAYGTVVSVEPTIGYTGFRCMTVKIDERPGMLLTCPYDTPNIVKGEVKTEARDAT